MPLQLLVEKRVGDVGAHAPQQQVPLRCDGAHHVAHLVERAGGEATRRAPSERERDVADPVARGSREEREERVRHRLLEPRHSRHGPEPQGQRGDARLGLETGRGRGGEPQ